MGYWVYLARCGNNSIYTGATTDLVRRMREHNQGGPGGRGAKYTAAHLPVILVQAWEVAAWSNALRLEHAIKRCSHREKEKLIAQPDLIYYVAERRRLIFPISEIAQDLIRDTNNSNFESRD